jgi:dipeptidyl aminopeptidase/acylaminoacyl peptidase
MKWVGKNEHAGVRAQPRKDLKPPPHWRLEAVARTPRPRSLTISADRRHACFIQDADTSDVYWLDLAGGAPERLTTGRTLTTYWDDDPARPSPDGSTIAYTEDEHVWLAPTAGGPAQKLVKGGSPVWIDDHTLVISVERDDTTRLAVVDTTDPWPRRLALTQDKGDEEEAAVSPDGTRVAFTFCPRDDLNRSEIRVADVATGETRAITGTPRMHDRTPAWSPDGRTIAYASERSGFYELHLSDRQLTHAGADHSEHAWHPDGTKLVAIRGRRNRFDLVEIDLQGQATVLAEGGAYGAPHYTADGDVIATYEADDTPPELRRGTTLHAPAPRAVRRAPHATLEEVTFPSFDGLEIPAFLMRPDRDQPVPAIVHPHGGPTDAHGDLWDGHAQYFVDKGYAWLQPNFRGSTGYGREFERANHGVWGVDDTKDCLAAADYLRGLDFIDGARLGVFGGSYGSYMALLCVIDDPEHRFRCAATKYGDCDILTSWAQGDRFGVQDLERMMDHPAKAREAYAAGSPFHRLANLSVPLLVAHGERDVRVHPRQSAQLVAELRRLGGKTFEYVTYPTEGHGFLNVEPQLDFYRRLERFLDWHLM